MPKVPPPPNYYRKRRGRHAWHLCQNCPEWPTRDFEFQKEAGEPLCEICVALEERDACR
jgi:hypothetical protein